MPFYLSILRTVLIFNLLFIFNNNAKAGQFEEGFESVIQLSNNGWIFDNQSDFVGDLSWRQGVAKFMSAQAGPDNSYILGGRGQTAGNVLCDWLILPDIGLVEQLNFYTRTEGSPLAPDRLVVAYSESGGTTTGPCINNQPAKNTLGQGLNDFGDFEVIFSVNPNLAVGGYPEDWTEFNVPVNGNGRLALVYFVEDVAQAPFNGNLIAIDSISKGTNPPTQGTTQPVPLLSLPGMILLLVMMLLISALVRKNQLDN